LQRRMVTPARATFCQWLPSSFQYLASLLLAELLLGPQLFQSAWSTEAIRHGQATAYQQSFSRSVLQQGSAREKERADAASHAISSSQVLFIGLMSLASLALLSFIGWKVMLWYQHRRRPGYVELQSLDSYHQPWSAPF